MKILVVYQMAVRNDRGTIYEHLNSFEHYSGAKVYYLNTHWGVPHYITKIRFDLVIYHYSFLSFTLRFPAASNPAYMKRFEPLKKLSGYKVAIPQDEYIYTDILNDFFKSFGIKSVFTLYPPGAREVLFPKDISGLEHYFTVYAGYLEETTAARVKKWQKPHSQRSLDLGYRARKLPYWIGRHSLTKWQLTDRFLETPIRHKLKMDLSNNGKDVFYGDNWYKFIGNCRALLGCESGASLYDPDGSIMKKVDNYVREHPDADFDEVERECFPGLDGKVVGTPVSPRIFETCMMKTCMVLVEGGYGGILKPNVHYIEIKKDYSNLEEVLRQIEDTKLCERIAETAYHDIVESGLYTYRKFVEFVLGHYNDVKTSQTDIVKDSYFCSLKLMIREWVRNHFPTFTAAYFSLLKAPYWLRWPFILLIKVYIVIANFCGMLAGKILRRIGMYEKVLTLYNALLHK